jgi:energy-coupling factor transporter ATP-binding protein EcfA2
MIIRKLHVESFGCLKDVTVELEPLTVFVGPNDSGKSMLLRALTTLAEASNAREGWRGVFPDAESVIAQTFNGRDDTIRVRLSGELGGAGVEYDVEVRAALGKPWVSSERLRLGDLLIDRKEAKLSLQGPGDSQAAADIPLGAQPLLHPEFWPHILLTPGGREHAGAVTALYGAVRAIDLYSLRPERLREPTSPLTPLSPEGLGLSNAVAEVLLRDRDVLERIENALAAAMPQVKRLGIRQNDGTNGSLLYELELITRSGARVPSSMVSDGVLLFLGYLYLVLGPNPASVLMIEEPETGIHFGLLRAVMDLFRKMAKGEHGGPPTQILLTTHSPLLLNLVDPEEIRIVRRDEDGATHVSPFTDAPDLAKLLDYQGPGEIWVNEGEEYLTQRSRSKP